ncbi:MAG: hypothetical protein P8018_03130 [Acidobacteriota bacterium]
MKGEQISHKSLFLLATAVACFIALSTAAQDIRPLQTEDIWMLPTNGISLQLGEDYIDGFHSIQDGRQGNLWQDAHMALRWGVSDRMELEVDGVPYKRWHADYGQSDAGVGDFSVFGKFRVWKGKNPGTGFGFRLGVKMPNTPSHKAFGTNQTDFYFSLIGGKGWGRVRVWSNVGIGILDNPFIRQTQDDVLTWGLAGSWDVTDTITLFGEVQGLWEGSDAPLYGRSNRAFRLGVRYGRGPHWAFDAAVAKTSGAYYGNWQATVGVSYRFHL